MITREPTLERLAVAQALMLEPFGLQESVLARALATIGEHRVDDADLYFQTTRHEGWSLEEGIVKSGSFSIDQGVGVRAVAGEKTAFAYSDELSEAALLDAARTVRTIAAAGQHKRVKLARAPRIAASRVLYAPTDPIATLDSAQKVALLEKVEKLARAKDPRVVQVMAGLAAEYDVVLVARADGTRAADVRPLVRLSVTVIAEQDGRREIGSGADAVRAERIEHGVVPEGRRVVAAEADFTETTQQAEGRTALPLLRRGAAAEAAAAGTRVRAERAFEPEAGTQAATQVFDATEAQAARRDAVLAQRRDVAGRAVLHVAGVQVDDTEEGDRRLGGSGTGERGQRGQGEQRFFHFNYLLG